MCDTGRKRSANDDEEEGEEYEEEEEEEEEKVTQVSMYMAHITSTFPTLLGCLSSYYLV
uniref:Uncharacterized protein n=1 Tax=Nelumbo nucifera TaxID=4432 RepID=A0A822ZGB3_NELNU|nr:TPA_asm: hypothetical protein HUJ06_003404 [Nelumbo nucifera]